MFLVIRYICWTLLVALAPLALYGQLVLQLTSWPKDTPAEAAFYAAGTFNQWHPGDTAYRFQTLQNGDLELELAVPPGNYEFKITRGSWAVGEGQGDGRARPNRQVRYEGGRQEVPLQVEGWEGEHQLSTAASNVHILTDSFAMPQLPGRARRIWVYLPPDYAHAKKAYPVLYMHDGQNLFDAATSFSGEWGVDETLNRLFAERGVGLIVVGIDNGGTARIAEYTPWANDEYGGGEGAQYVDFLVQTLKPFIDRNYRTLRTARHTGIMGSSLGGLISLYAGLRHPDIFGRVGVFSPSLWFTDVIYAYAERARRHRRQRLYLLAGELENSDRVSMTGDLLRLDAQLRRKGYHSGQLFTTTHSDGRHKEWFWARELGPSIEWLFFR